MQLKIGYLFQCPPRASPWVITDAPCRPVRAKALKFVIAFLRTTLQRYGNFLILPNFTLQSYVKRI